MKISSKNIGLIGFLGEELCIITKDGFIPISNYQANKLGDITNIPCRLATFKTMRRINRKEGKPCIKKDK